MAWLEDMLCCLVGVKVKSLQLKTGVYLWKDINVTPKKSELYLSDLWSMGLVGNDGKDKRFIIITVIGVESHEISVHV